jgi:uncharacterized protein (DUF488 family)
MTRSIWTVGHSNHGIETFLRLLSGSSIRQLADVRRFPSSRRHPHFERDALENMLATAGIGYRHFEALGGRRSGRAHDSPNTGWRVAAFSAFADYMDTPDFRAALEELEGIALEQPTVVMCAEAMPWQCHRRLISDALTVKGWSVCNILAAGKVEQHRMTEFARVAGGRLTYPAAQEGTADEPLSHNQDPNKGD